MTKIRSLFNLSGTMDGKTFVDSRRYRPHFRGSRTSSNVNSTLQRKCSELEQAIPFAKLVKDSFNPYLKNFKDGTLWTRLCAVFRAQLRDKGQITYAPLEGMQLHEKHSLLSRLQGKMELATTLDDEQLQVSIKLNRHPHFTMKYINAYRITVVVVAISDDNKALVMDHLFPTTKLSDKAMGEQMLHFDATKKLKSFIVAMKCEGYQDDEVMNNLQTTGMDILRVVVREELMQADNGVAHA